MLTIGLCSGLILIGGQSHAAATPSKKQLKPHIRNLPEIDLTATDHLAIDQEFNLSGLSGLSNSTLDYGFSHDWNLGFSLLNAQFYGAQTWLFQPDALLNVEKHWQYELGRLVVGSHAGAGFFAQGTSFINYSYLEFQQHFEQWDADFDVGSYYGNAALAGFQSAGLHFNLELPLVAGLRLNSDYLSGSNGLSSATFKLLYPVAKDWQLGLGMQIATAQGVSDPYQGMLGIYFH
ncbi:MAG: hypothetical protein ACKN9F_10865 [Methylomonas sp.]